MAGAPKTRTPMGTVYVLPMATGLDQYLANHLTMRGFAVTTNRAAAEVVLTDRLGAEFERQVKEIRDEVAKKNAPPAPADPPAGDAKADAKVEAKVEAKAAKPAKGGEKELSAAEERRLAEDAKRISEQELQRPVSTFSRGRGNIYLVDLGAERVIWSTYERAKDRRPDTLNRNAREIAEELAESFGPKN
jgi:hypothetical protein